MTLPELVRERLGDEEAVERVALGGDDEVVVTPTRTLLYRSEGLLSGESVEEYSLTAERISVSEGRRKSTIRLEHGLEGDGEFTVPSKRVDDVLRPVLAGVLTTAGVTDGDEPVRELYRLGELSVIVTDKRVIKHIGNAVWDEEFEEFAFEDVTALETERGDVSSQIIIEVDGRPDRIKTPSEDARAIREHIERRLLDYHEVADYAAFRELVAPDEDDETDRPDADPAPGEEEEAPEADPAESVEEFDDTGLIFDVDAESDAVTEPDESDSVAEELATLREAVERHNDVLQSQQRTIEQLIDELRRGR